MGCYRPEDPAMNFCYKIENKDIYKKIVETAFDWYKVSEYNKEHPDYYSDYEMCYNKLIAEIDGNEDDGNDGEFGYYLDASNELFSEYLYDVVPFEINHIEEHSIYLTPCYDKKDIEYSSYRAIDCILYYGDDIEAVMTTNNIDFNNPYTLNFVKHFLKFLCDADLNEIKDKFSWKFIHSSWD